MRFRSGFAFVYDTVTARQIATRKVSTIRRLHNTEFLTARREGSMACNYLTARQDRKLAVELDGAQHLADSDAYRRDRRKDMLLQENDCVVLRFLAEDVGTHLDDVLDTILRTLAHQQRGQP
jgi:very-short-patch-repair endonuclease